MNPKIVHWDPEWGLLGEDTMRQRLEAEGYRVSKYHYTPGTYFPAHTHSLDKKDTVLRGRLQIGWEGASGVTIRANTFARGARAIPNWRLLSFENKQPSTSIVLQDSVSENGADILSFLMHPIGFGGWGGPAEYVVQWTVSVLVEDASGRPVAGASLETTDRLGNKRSYGPTDGKGAATLILNQFRRFNSVESAARTEDHTPHKLVISKTGFATRILDIQADRPQRLQIVLQQDNR